jgi:hypothetical protein
VECIWIIKQKVVLFPKFKENQKEAVVDALMQVQYLELIHNILPFKLDLLIGDVS